MDDIFLSRIRSCLAGESAGWEWIASILLNKLRHHYPSYSSDVHEDLVQIICERLLTGLPNFRGTSEYELLNYLRTAAIREGISYHRHTVRRQDVVSLDEPLDDGNNGYDLHDLLPDSDLGPDRIAELNDLYRKASLYLPLKDRQIMHYKVQGYKDREIAELLGIPLGTVANDYKRAREQLRTVFILLLIIFFERKLPWVAS